MRAVLPFIFLLITQLHFAQDSDAELFLKKSLDAYGNWNQIKSFEYEVDGQRDGGAQAKTYKGGAKQKYTARRIYNLAEDQLYEHNVNYFPGGYVFSFITTVNDTVAVQYDLTGSRTGKIYNTAGKSVSDSRLKVRENHIAYFKVKELLETADELQLVESDTSKSIIVRRLKDSVQVAEYHFSPASLLLEKMSAGPQEIFFGGYQDVSGRMDNSTVELIFNEKPIFEEKVAVKRVNFSFDESLLKTPGDYKKAESLPVAGPVEIAKDIYLIENLAGDRNVLFVNMNEYVVVIEAPINPDLSKQVSTMIKEIAKDKPVKYVFTTHYHSDHTGGLKYYVEEEGAELIMAVPTQVYVKELLAGQRQEGTDTNEPNFLTVEDKLILKDADHELRFLEVPNSHADGMTLVWFPEEKIIYQGDLLSVPKDGTLTTLIEVTKEMIEFLDEKQLHFQRMIGHHGHNNITPVMLEEIKKIK